MDFVRGDDLSRHFRLSNQRKPKRQRWGSPGALGSEWVAHLRTHCAADWGSDMKGDCTLNGLPGCALDDAQWQKCRDKNRIWEGGKQAAWLGFQLLNGKEKTRVRDPTGTGQVALGDWPVLGGRKRLWIPLGFYPGILSPGVLTI